MKQIKLMNIINQYEMEEYLDEIINEVSNNKENDIQNVVNNMLVKELLVFLQEYNQEIHKVSNELEIKLLDMINNLRKSISKNELNDEKIKNAKDLLNKGEVNMKETLLDYFNELKEKCKLMKKTNISTIKNIVGIFKMNKFDKIRLLYIQGRVNKTLDQIVEMAEDELREVEISQLINALADEINLAEKIYLKRIKIDEKENLEIDKYYELETQIVSISSKYKAIKEYKDLAKLASQEGFLYERQAGSHAVYKNESNKIVVIPDKTGVAPIGTQISIIKMIFN